MTADHDSPSGPLPRAATASAILVSGAGILLERRSDDTIWSPGLWDSPGGKLERGESPRRALLREIREELGVELMDYALVAVVDEEPGHVPVRCRHHVYLARSWSGKPRPVEGQCLAWVDARWAAASSECHPLIRATLRRALSEGWL